MLLGRPDDIKNSIAGKKNFSQEGLYDADPSIPKCVPMLSEQSQMSPANWPSQFIVKSPQRLHQRAYTSFLGTQRVLGCPSLEITSMHVETF